MDENNNRMRLNCETQSAAARRKKALQHEHARAMWFPSSRSHDEEVSGSRSRLPRGSLSQTHVHQEETPATHDDLPPLADSYPEGPIDTSLPIHYRDHVVPHVLDEEVYLLTLVIFCFKQIQFE